MILLGERATHSRVLSHPGYFNFSPYSRLKRGRINWYRYQKYILELLLLPAYYRFAILYPDRPVYLIQDGASNYTS